MTDHARAIEAGARALVRDSWYGSDLVDGEGLAESGEYDQRYRVAAKACIEAAIASGALVPAGAGKPDRLVIARAICRSDNGPGVPSCVMDDHPEREPCNETNCRRFEQADAVIRALDTAPASAGLSAQLERAARKCEAVIPNEYVMIDDVPYVRYSDLKASVKRRADEIRQLNTAPASAGQRAPLDWGKLVQCILRCMDATIKNESSREQAERIATAIEERFDTAPASRDNTTLATSATNRIAKVVSMSPETRDDVHGIIQETLAGLAPASGDYVVVPRVPTEDMANAAECAEPFSFEAMWEAALNAASRTGGGK